jgi:hypothetical protein
MISAGARRQRPWYQSVAGHLQTAVTNVELGDESRGCLRRKRRHTIPAVPGTLCPGTFK